MLRTMFPRCLRNTILEKKIGFLSLKRCLRNTILEQKNRISKIE
jgi:hypothetical protein